MLQHFYISQINILRPRVGYWTAFHNYYKLILGMHPVKLMLR